MNKDNTYRYAIPVNEPNEENGSVTMLLVAIQDNHARRRRVIMKQILRDYYNLTRKEALRAIRELGFDDILCVG